MNAILPDISLTEHAPYLHPLDGVGMQGIEFPVSIAEDGYQRELPARADLQVDLPVPHVKGIHMSRLYRVLNGSLASGEVLSPASVRKLLEEMIETHKDCGSESAYAKISFDLLLRRPALMTEGLAGWKSYPVCLEASLVRGVLKLRLEVGVTYSSTCPCSAALSRQLIEKGFLETFAGKDSVSTDDVASWLRENATLATPHSQRSKAEVSIVLDNDNETSLNIIALIDRIENALMTPVQTAVKRADEQAFAALNGQNLMFVEDATRRIEAVLKDCKSPKVFVRHMESLHPHDAVAWSTRDDG